MSKSNQFGKSPGTPQLRDFQHAARLFVDGDMRLAPKAKFLYHVKFNINSSALVDQSFKDKYQTEVNMLVKAAELPKFNVQIDTLNQYNRKKNTQVKIEYQPIQIRFHDDNEGVTRKLWENYFKYYYADSNSADQAAAYKRTAMKSYSYITSKYGLDNKSSDPFFTDITIYQMDKKNWNSYKLINPIIQSWSHDSLDYSQSQPAEQTMTLVYESVAYGSGTVSAGNPPGFAMEHYDSTKSPYTGGGGAASATSALLSPNAITGALVSAVSAIKLYEGVKAMGIQSVANNISANLGSISTQAISGIKDTAFPTSAVINKTVAVAKKILGT
jgi:hypothetical protein